MVFTLQHFLVNFINVLPRSHAFFNLLHRWLLFDLKLFLLVVVIVVCLQVVIFSAEIGVLLNLFALSVHKNRLLKPFLGQTEQTVVNYVREPLVHLH